MLEERTLLSVAGAQSDWSIIPDEVLVGLRTEERLFDVRPELEALEWPAALGPITAQNATRVYSIPNPSPNFEGGFLTVLRVYLPDDVGVYDAMEQLDPLDFIEFAEPNGFFSGPIAQSVPNDHRIGHRGQYLHERINNYEAWDYLEAAQKPKYGDSSVIVAVTDSGIELNHPDLENNIWVNPQEIYNGIDDDENGYIDDINGWNFTDWDEEASPPMPGNNDVSDDNPDDKGHGTHVAGIVAAEADNEIGVAGTAGGVTIMPLKVKMFEPIWDPGSSLPSRAAAFEYAVANGARIVNTSLGLIPEGPSEPGFETYRNVMDHMYNNGVLHINAAGNKDVRDPAWFQYTQTLYVAATDRFDAKAAFGSDAARSSYGRGVDISAPGLEILSTVPLHTSYYDPYGRKGGTSMAAPVAAGVAALILSADASLSRDQLAAILMGTADYIDDLNFDFYDGYPDGEGTPPGPGQFGLEGMLGTGRVNSARAVEAALDNAKLPPPQIEGIVELRDSLAVGTTQLTVRLANVFDRQSVEAYTLQGPPEDQIKVADNFQLVFAGPDGEFGAGGDDKTVPLSLDLWTDDFTNDPGYKVGTNELKFNLYYSDTPYQLEQGAYAFTAFAYDQTTRPNGLKDPWDPTVPNPPRDASQVALDGNRDGTGGDDYVRYFYVGTPNQSLNVSPPPPGSADVDIELRASTQKPGYVDVSVEGAPTESYLVGKLTGISITGSTGDDRITVQHLEDLFRHPSFFDGTITIDGAGGDDRVTAYGSPQPDRFEANVEEGTFFQIGRFLKYTVPTQRYTIEIPQPPQATINKFTAHGGGPADLAVLSTPDTPADEDIFQASVVNGLLNGRLYGPGYYFDFRAQGFGQISAASVAGGNDRATFTASDADDTVWLTPELEGKLSAGGPTGGLSAVASGFARYEADATGSPGHDSAILFGHQAADHLEADANWAEVAPSAGADPWTRVVGFDTVYPRVTTLPDTDNIQDITFELFPINTADVYFWDEEGGTWWGELGQQPFDYRHWLFADGSRADWAVPSPSSYAVVEGDTVGLSISQGLREVGNLTLVGGGIGVLDDERYWPPALKLKVFEDFQMNADARYTSALYREHTTLLEVVGDAYLDGTLIVWGTRPLADSQQDPAWGDITRSIITAAGPNGVTGTFASEPTPYTTVPNEGDYLGSGMWYAGTTYSSNAVDVTVFQALGGDTDGDVDVDFADFNNLANNYTGPNEGDPQPVPGSTFYKDWKQGDFDGDWDVDFADYNTLANNYTGSGGYSTQGRAGGGRGESALIQEMLRRNYTPPAWLYDNWLARVYRLQPNWLLEVEQVLAQDQVSDKSLSAEAADKLLELLALELA